MSAAEAVSLIRDEATVASGGFVGIAKHDVAIPFAQLKQEGDKLVLPGATKDALKALLARYPGGCAGRRAASTVPTRSAA